MLMRPDHSQLLILNFESLIVAETHELELFKIPLF